MDRLFGLRIMHGINALQAVPAEESVLVGLTDAEQDAIWDRYILEGEHDDHDHNDDIWVLQCLPISSEKLRRIANCRLCSTTARAVAAERLTKRAVTTE